MRTFRLIVPTILFAVVLVGCVIQADSHSDQSPFAPTATPTADAVRAADECRGGGGMGYDLVERSGQRSLL